MSLSETTLENVIRAWVAGALAGVVSDTSVIWDRQKVNQRAAPYLTLRLVGPSGPGLVAEERQIYDPAGAAGQEIEDQTIHHHEYTLRVQAYATTPAGARTAIMKIHDRAFSRSGRSALRDATPSIVVAGVGTVQDVGALVETDWQGRTALDLTLRLADIDSERTTFIETVGVTDGLT